VTPTASAPAIAPLGAKAVPGPVRDRRPCRYRRPLAGDCPGVAEVAERMACPGAVRPVTREGYPLTFEHWRDAADLESA
jgi:hypothetical protein